MNLTGTLNNTNATLTLNAAAGPWVLNGGTVPAGPSQTSGGASLIVNGSGTLDRVTVNGVLDVGNSYGGARLDGAGRADTQRYGYVGNPTNGWTGQVNFAGSQNLGGNGTVVFGNGYWGSAYGWNLWGWPTAGRR